LRRYLPTLRSIEDEAEMTAKAHELLGNMFSQVTEEAKQGLGPVKQLGNAWGDFQERMGEGLIRILGKAAKALTRLITPKQSKLLKVERIELNQLVGVITNVNTQNEDRLELLKRLQTKYPDFLENLNIEKVTNTELRDRLIEVNEAYDEKIKAAVRQELIAKKSNKLAKLTEAEYEAIKRLEYLQSDAAKNMGANREIEIKATEAVIKKNQERRQEIEKEIEETTKLLDKNKESNKGKKDDNDLTEKQKITIDSLNATLKKQQEELTGIDIANEAAIKTKVKDIAATKEQIKAVQEYIDKLNEVKKSMPGGTIAPIKGKADIDVTTGPLAIDTSLLDTMKEQNFTLGEMKQKYLDLAEGYNVFERAIIEGNVMAAESINELTSYIENLDNGMLAMQASALEFGQAMMASSQMGISSLKDYAKYALNTAKKIIAAKIAEGIAGTVSNALKDVPFPFNIVAAGIAGGAAAALFNSIVPSFAEGGAAYGPTLAMVGEAAGVSSSNPEYIGTARQLAQMGAGRGGGQLTARISRNDLLFILNEGNSYSKRTY